MAEFSGKTILVTGGARGVGKAIAELLAARGARIVLNYFHSHDAAQETCAALRAQGAEVELIRASVAQREQVERMFAEIRARVGGLDGLVNNAAAGALRRFAEFDEQYFDRALDTNVKGALRCARAALPLMRARGGGAIVNISSLGAWYPLQDYAMVGPSKAALESLTRYLAAEYAADNIRVNTASAGLLDTEVIRQFPDYERMRAAWEQATPFGRLGTARELAEVVVFLLSDASRWINGQTILADGGVSLSGLPQFTRVADSVPKAAALGTADTPRITVDADPVVCVGMGLVVPGAASPADFWELLQRGPDLVTTTPRTRWDTSTFVDADPQAEDKSYSPEGYFITDEVCPVAPGEEHTTAWLRHALSQAMAEVRQAEDCRWTFVLGCTPDGNQALEERVARDGFIALYGEALAAAGDESETTDRAQADIAACLTRHYRHAGRSPGGLPHQVAAAAISGILPDGTRMYTIDTACSSGLYAVDFGAKQLRAGHCEAVVCAGAMALEPLNNAVFSKLRGLSRSGRPLPLARETDGVLFADGAAVVVLKRLSRARADGDRVLGVLCASGCSSDGRGKSVAAPNPQGQRRALERALAHCPETEAMPWIALHATGTPSGDDCECEVVRAIHGQGHDTWLTANKGTIGHTGWAAGIVSLIEVLLGLQRGEIPAQPRLAGHPDIVTRDDSRLHVSREAVPWPSGRPRCAGVSSFGFGGTNAHLVIAAAEAVQPGQEATAQPADECVVVGWAMRVPDLDDRTEHAAWLRGTGHAPGQSFGAIYPVRNALDYGVTPRAVRTLDRGQLMAIDCARALWEQLGVAADELADRAGVFIGHMGKTRHAALNGLRCYLDDVRAALTAASPPVPAEVHEYVQEHVHAMIPPLNEDSFPGMMPNVIAGRVAACLDLHGPALTVDTGFSASLAAVDVARAYLADASVDVALVGGISGVSDGPAAIALHAAAAAAGSRLCEGAFMVALARRSTAQALELPILAALPAGSDTPGADGVIECGLPSDDRAHYAGAEGARGLIAALLGPERHKLVTAGDGRGRSRPAIRVMKPEVSARSAEPDAPLRLQRQVVRLVPLPDEASGIAQPFLPPRTLVLTHTSELHAALTQHAPDATVVNVMGGIPPEEDDGAYEHLRVVADLGGAIAPGDATRRECRELTELHDATFLALQRLELSLRHEGSSCIGLFLNGLSAGTPHALSGLFAGLFNGAAIELAPCRSAAIFTASGQLGEGLREAQREMALRRLWPAVYRDGDRRYSYVPAEDTGSPRAATEVELGPDAVILAVGGTRGATAAIVRALAERARPRIYLLGSTPLDTCSEEDLTLSDAEFEARRVAFISEQRQLHPTTPVRDIIAHYYRVWAARAARRTLAALREACGAERVTYCCCDVTDREQVSGTVQDILAREGRVDMVLFGAGFDRSQSLAMKTLADFRAVRDVKYKGYVHLKAALAGHMPRAWCNFGSIVSAVPCLPGQVDYLAANTFLNTAAQYATEKEGVREVTLGWSIWGETGMFTAPYNKSVAHVIRDTGFFTEMTTREGVAHFCRELGRQDPIITFLGPHEKCTGAKLLRLDDPFRKRLLPQFDDSAMQPEESAGDFYLDRAAAIEQDEAEFERTFDCRRDAYLAHHRVNGYPTLPGTFVAEIAAEAAQRLVPGMVVTALAHIEFTHFLRVRMDGTLQPVRIRARVLERAADCARVSVKVTSDIVGPRGHVLQHDRQHFALEVELAARHATPPSHGLVDEGSMRPVPDPYHCAEAAIHLSGPFVTTGATRANEDGAAARLRVGVTREDPVFSRFSIPVLLLDGLARVAVLTPEELLPLAAPRRIERIELYTGLNDVALADATGAVTLQAVRGTHAGGPGALQCAECRACDGAGTVLARIIGLDAVVTGYIEAATGAFLTVRQVQARTATTRDAAGAPTEAELRAAVRRYEESVQALARPAPARTFAEQVTLMTEHLRGAQALGEYYFERSVSQYNGAWVEVAGRRMLMLASYSYLDLLQHPRVTAAAKQAIERFGTGTHGARLLAGTTDLHRELEQALAAFKGTEDAIVFPSGYATNLGTISTLVGEGDTVICDTQNHASIADGAAFSNARCLAFSHHDLSTLERRLAHRSPGKTLVVVDAVFSMDGDIAPLPGLIELCRTHGAWLMVDEAHSTGVLGATGHGICEHFGIDGREIQVHMGTLSKSLASVGGYVAAAAEVVCALKNHARSFVFSAALPPAQTAAARAALAVLEDEPERVARLQRNADTFRAGLRAAGFDTLHSVTPIVPVLCGTVVATLQMAHACWDAGLFVVPVFFPAVPLDAPRLRTIVTAAHTDADIAQAVEALTRAGHDTGVLDRRVPARSAE